MWLRLVMSPLLPGALMLPFVACGVGSQAAESVLYA